MTYYYFYLFNLVSRYVLHLHKAADATTDITDIIQERVYFQKIVQINNSLGITLKINNYIHIFIFILFL